MKYKNAKVFLDKGFKLADFETKADRFAAISPCGTFKDDAIDLSGKYVIPGLVDCHIHGAMNTDFSQCNRDSLLNMSHYLAQEGITSFAPTSISIDYDTLSKAYSTALALHKEMPDNHSRIMGIHMEGPYFSEEKKGAHKSEFLKMPDIEGFMKLFNDCEGLIKIADVAPELPGALDFIKEVSKVTRVSVAHSAANYEEAAAGFDNGATHLTHLYNGMPSIHHRMPGVIGAASERNHVIAELICDGYHVHESAVRMAFKLFPNRICLISDALNCLGMPEGVYNIGNFEIELYGGVAKVKDSDTIAGAATNIYKGMLNAINFGVDINECIIAATLTPAKQLGCDDMIGSIQVGKYADFNICGENLALEKTFIGGKQISSAP